MKKSISFEFTPQICRYIKELHEFSVDFVGDENFGRKIETFELGEKITPRAFLNVSKFVKYVEDNDIVECRELESSVKQLVYNDVTQINPPDEYYGTQWAGIIKNRVKLNTLFQLAMLKEPSSTRVHIEWYNSESKSLRFGSLEPHDFRKGKKFVTQRIKIFENLWSNRRHIFLGNTVKKGRRQPIKTFARDIGFTFDIKDDGFNDDMQQKLADKAHYIIKSLKTDGFPISFSRKNGLLITCEE